MEGGKKTNEELYHKVVHQIILIDPSILSN